MSKSDPSVNPNAKPEQEQTDPNAHTDSQKHRSVESQVEGGQNEYEGEPHPGYGNSGQNQGSSGDRQ